MLWAAAYPNQAAYDQVQSATDQLLAAITENREIYREDGQRFYQDVDVLLSQVIDFKRIARRVMAKFYKKASIDQREKFQQVFKQSLMKLYAGGLLEFNNEKVRMLPPTGRAKAKKDKQKVNVEIELANGNVFPLSYSMYKNKSEEWKVENVVVNGINIGLTYRNQFARLMKTNKNDVDLAITDWNDSINSESEE